MPTPKKLKGQCLCGAVRFEATGPFRDVSYCHCRQCARWSGSFVAATAVAPHRFKLTKGEQSLKWFAASAEARRGFCGECGSSLFWKPNLGTHISIMAGTLDPPTGIAGSHHIFVADKSDYYRITDGLAQHDQWGSPSPVPAKS
jgi:hypothetical protein